jgi:hypothetical protein
VYSLKRAAGLCNRLLAIFPTDAQLDQFILDGERDLRDAGVGGPLKIIDIRHAGTTAYKHHQKNTRQIFAITIQSLVQDRGGRLVNDLLGLGQWMIVVDEYHHYGTDKTWGRAVLGLNRAFLMVLSATPTRSARDGAFGLPHVSVSYRQAVSEGAVKPLKAHAYSYRVEAITEDQGTLSFTTDELIEAAGSAEPEAIEKLRIERKMRWSPKYVSPLVSIPIDRMLRSRLDTKYKLQALISAMCVSHAALVCEQVRSMYPELRVDWVGTGENGRTPEENERALRAFCPQKDENGIRHPELDVLVHVGMAGEGLDAILVSEIVLLCNASICNKILQIIGRGARYIPGVECNISFDSSSEFASKEYLGSAIMDAMDMEPPQKEETTPDNPADLPPPPPQNPDISIFNVELLEIDSGSDGVRLMAEVVEQTNPSYVDFAGMSRDPSHPDWSAIIELYRTMRKKEAAEHDERAVHEQWRDKVSGIVSGLTGAVLIMLKRAGRNVDDQVKLRGEIKKAINTRKKQVCGAIENDIEVLTRHYGWCVALDRDIRERGSLPSWLLSL